MTPFIILLAVALLKHKQSLIEGIVIVVSNLLYCQSWFPNETVFWSLNGATWFLSSLLFCYVTTSFYFKLLHRINPKVMVAAIFIMKFTWEALVSLLSPQNFIYLAYIFPVYRSLDFALGLCLGTLYLEGRKKKYLPNKNKQYLLVGVIFVYFIVLFFINKSVTYSVYHLMETFIVWMAISDDNCIARIIFENPIAIHLGDLSDIIFLIHLPIITVIRLLWEKSKIGHDSILWGILVCTVICAAEITSVLMWTMKEKLVKVVSLKSLAFKSAEAAFCFSLTIEFLQLFLRVGTFQLSDLCYNTLGGCLGGIVYWISWKIRHSIH